jgi:glycosyltransferase involved in cell wall biosynthesis
MLPKVWHWRWRWPAPQEVMRAIMDESDRMSLPRVMMVHNAYQQAGGEDGVVAAELKLLRDRGHEVIELRRDNLEIQTMAAPRVAADTLWSASAHAQALEMLRTHRPDIVHVHNTFPLISPSLYWACAKAGVPVVQTLHNFRLACPQAMFLRDGKVCESCLGKMPWPALWHGCYRGSRVQTAVMFGMLAVHRAAGTYENKVSRYIALSEFGRNKFIEAGLPSQRIVVKPNFVVGATTSHTADRRGMLFVGRLSAEKGIAVLGEAWRACSGTDLRVAGVGEADGSLQASEGIDMLGKQTAAQVQREMMAATALVLPSICFENFPLTLVEAFSCGLPVIASRIGALAELVEHGVTGLLFTPGDAADLARTVQWAAAHPQEMATMGRNARALYERRYTPEVNHRQLLNIYRAAIAEVQMEVAHV